MDVRADSLASPENRLVRTSIHCRCRWRNKQSECQDAEDRPDRRLEDPRGTSPQTEFCRQGWFRRIAGISTVGRERVAFDPWVVDAAEAIERVFDLPHQQGIALYERERRKRREKEERAMQCTSPRYVFEYPSADPEERADWFARGNGESEGRSDISQSQKTYGKRDVDRLARQKIYTQKPRWEGCRRIQRIMKWSLLPSNAEAG